jgi:hypothetical protein
MKAGRELKNIEGGKETRENLARLWPMASNSLSTPFYGFFATMLAASEKVERREW